MENDLKTSEWVDSLIDNLAAHDLAEEIRGDLYELFLKDIKERGIRSAKKRYVLNGLGFLAKSFFWRKSDTNANSFVMLRSYFKMARRSLSAYRGTAIINALGLVIGMASALVILTVIRFELGFNKFHSDVDRIYRMVRVSGDDMSEFRTGISYPVPRAIKAEVAGMEDITSMEYFGGSYVDVLDPSGKSIAMFKEDFGCVLVEPSFFKIFDFKDSGFEWIAGNPANALVEPFSVVLTETMARKYFPEGNALGKPIRFEKYYDARITGVISDLPANCDFPFSILISYSSLEIIRKGRLENWFSVNDTHQAYVKLAPGVTQEEMEEKIAAVHAGHTPKDLYESRHYLLQKLSDVHHDSRFGTYSGRTISKETVTALAIIGLFLLLTAGINYINLSTAQSSLRSKEIGLRKVLGSNRKNLIGQFMMETFILVLISGIFALVVAEILLLKLQPLVNLKLDGFNFTDPFFLLSLLLIVLVVTLFSGSYPSLITSGFNPVMALKNKFSGETGGNISLRKVLVVSQFTITQVLVVGTFIVVSQMRYFRDVNMGFNREAIITLNLPSTSPREAVSEISNQLISQSFVSGFSFSSTLPSGVKRNRSFMDIGKNDASAMKDFVVYEYQSIDSSYLDVYQIKLLAGRSLGIRDSNANVLINKTLLNTLQLGSPEDALNQELKMGGGPAVTVVGVIDDFYSNSLKEPVDNMLLAVNPRAHDFCSIKINTKGGGSLQDALKNVERIWTKTYPDHLFNYQFFDENVQAFYAQEEKYAKLFQVFSIIFLIIGCLGLYGLITFVVNRKGKEVAIRKVLGASLSNILLMFSTEYIRLILLSFVLAVPVTYYVVNEWLSNFANHIELEWWFFVMPGLVVLAIAMLVIISKSLRTANANPVDRLKYE